MRSVVEHFFLLVLALTAFDLVNFLFESCAGTVNGKRPEGQIVQCVGGLVDSP